MQCNKIMQYHPIPEKNIAAEFLWEMEENPLTLYICRVVTNLDYFLKCYFMLLGRSHPTHDYLWKNERSDDDDDTVAIEWILYSQSKLKDAHNYYISIYSISFAVDDY